MRVLSKAAMTVFFVAGVSSAAFATSVLVPECDGGNCSKPNYGLVPGITEKKAGDAPENKPVEVPAVTGNEPVSQQTAKEEAPYDERKDYKTEQQLNTAGGASANVKITPGGDVSKEAGAENAKMQEFMRAAGIGQQSRVPANLPKDLQEKLQEYLEQKAREKIKPPLIINDIPLSPEDASVFDSLPGSLSVSVGQRYMWGAKDVELIKEAFGYDGRQIPANCQLRMDGVLDTTDGLYSVIVYSGQRSVAKYGGIINKVRFVPRAVCNVPSGPLPQNGSIITRVGDKLSIQLTDWVNCGAAAGGNSGFLDVQYEGDGKGVCRYN